MGLISRVSSRTYRLLNDNKMHKIFKKFKLLFLVIVSSILFCTGYFNSGQINSISDEKLSCNNFLNKNTTKSYKNFVMIILDGFRYDYFERHNSYIPFLSKKSTLKNSWIFKTKAGMPTVTMPQIKSMVTGNKATY